MDVQPGVRHVSYRHSFVLHHSKCHTHEGKTPIINITVVLKIEVKNSLRFIAKVGIRSVERGIRTIPATFNPHFYCCGFPRKPHP